VSLSLRTASTVAGNLISLVFVRRSAILHLKLLQLQAFLLSFIQAPPLCRTFFNGLQLFARLAACGDLAYTPQTERESTVLADWQKKFEEKYPICGKLVVPEGWCV
jgi:hypothetical protein